MARRRHSELSQALRFAVALLVLLGAVAAWSAWRGHGRLTVVAGAGALLAPALAWLAAPAWLAFFRAWMRFAEALSWVSTRIILTLFFFGFFTPFCAVRRLFGSRPLDVSWKDGRASYWIDREPVEPSLERYRRPY